MAQVASPAASDQARGSFLKRLVECLFERLDAWCDPEQDSSEESEESAKAQYLAVQPKLIYPVHGLIRNEMIE